jgi:hypothetical protein
MLGVGSKAIAAKTLAKLENGVPSVVSYGAFIWDLEH